MVVQMVFDANAALWTWLRTSLVVGIFAEILVVHVSISERTIKAALFVGVGR
jgi:hypothetical protein